MSNYLPIVEELKKTYQGFAESLGFPELEVSPASQAGESYRISYAGGVLHLNPQGPLAAAFGIGKAVNVLKAGHLAESIGEHCPCYPLRPLWFGSGRLCGLASSAGACIPDFFFQKNPEEAVHLFCRRVIELGYNAVMFGSRQGMFLQSMPEGIAGLSNLLSIIQRNGLKIIIKPSFCLAVKGQRNFSRCPMDPNFKTQTALMLEELARAVPFDFLFWEGGFLHPDFREHAEAREATEADLVSSEVKFLEGVLLGRAALIYYVPGTDLQRSTRHAGWMSALCDEMGQGSILAFSSVVGELCEDHQPDHPFWTKLRTSPDCSSTRLLPVVNIGAVRQGEGLWPCPSIDLIERFYARCRVHPFAGVLGLLSRIPSSTGLLDSSLWAASQYLWRRESPFLALESWFLANRPDLDHILYRDVLKRGREMALRLSFMRSVSQEANRDLMTSEEARLLGESIMADLRLLESVIENEEKKKFKRSSFPSMRDYFIYFGRDAKKTLVHFLQCFNIPAFNLLQLEDLQDSFWTQAASLGPGQGARGGAAVAFLDEPDPGPPGSRMQMVYKENRLL